MSQPIVTVVAVKATNLPNKEKIGKSDPYCQIEIQNTSQKTPKIDSELNPQWNHKMDFELKGPLTSSDQLKATVYDHEMVGPPKFLGETSASLGPLMTKRKLDLELQLFNSKGQPNGGMLTLHLEYSGPSERPKAEGKDQARQAPVQGGAMSGESGVASADAEGDGDVDGGYNDAPREVDASGWVVPKVRAPRSTKPQDWQIRIKILEARQLVGANISPICRVTCYKEMRATRTKKSTNSPFWDQSFTFNFHKPASELFDELVVFTIYNARKLRKDSMLCSFKCDIGMIYDSDQHTLTNKWLLMTDLEDLSAGPKGYLKVCMCVIGPGDEAPSFKAAESSEDEDIESNILRPSGMQVRAASFQLRIYRCEDLPRMDPDFIPGIIKKVIKKNQQDMTDPFVAAFFAGKEIATKTKYQTYNPVYNEELQLFFQFPSMCERIRLRVMDWDRLSENDSISACQITISEISAKGRPGEDGSESGSEGFLPTFGPTYISMYGSPREFAAVNEFDHLNKGRGEGAAYRGRILVELKTILEDKVEDTVNAVDIPRDDILRVEKFQRKRKFWLCTAFMSAGMISRNDDLVEFEVSIGNYGNMLDESVKVGASTTVPSCPIADGNFYYFIPWTNNKPCCVIESNWEDTIYRLEAQNVLRHTVVRLSINLDRVHLALKSKLSIQKTAALISGTIEQLIWDCKVALPDLVGPQMYATDLDHNLKALREAELKRIALAAQALIESRDEEDPETKLENCTAQLESFLASLKSLSIEPQNSIPDVIIWMLTGGEKRVAYARIPVNEILYSSNPERCGLKCGKAFTVYLKKMVRKGDKQTLGRRIPAQLRVKMWFGHYSQRNVWNNFHLAGTVMDFAELYEYESLNIGKVLDIGKSRWSDAKGKVELSKDNYKLPPGWKFEDNWFVDPDASLPEDTDAGHTQYVQDIYENEYRVPGTEWKKPGNDFTDVDNNKIDKNMQCPNGWRWEDDWAVDYNRPCDEEGWEYSVDGSKDSFVSVAKAYHLCRRRRLLRSRVRVAQTGSSTSVQMSSDGWEYGTVTGKFHVIKKNSDTQKRRRYRRRVTQTSSPLDSGLMPDKPDKEKGIVCPPRSYIVFKDAFRYQLRAYIYQARDLRAGDDSGYSDPYAHVCFINSSQTTAVYKKTVSPKWDQTLIFNNVVIHGDPVEVAENLPDVVIEVFDHDNIGEHDYLGRAIAKPVFRVKANQREPPALLEWWPIHRGQTQCGELLASFELFLINEKDQLPSLPPQKHRSFIVPEGIRPAMQLTRIEILCWGVRNLEPYMFTEVDSPFVEFEIDGSKRVSTVIKKTKKNPNFTQPAMSLDVRLPVEQLYMPPMNITVRDHREFGRKPAVGHAAIKHLEEMQHKQFSLVDPRSPDPIVAVLTENVGIVEAGEFTAIDMPASKAPEPTLSDAEKKSKQVGLITLEEEVDWWAKFYASSGDRNRCLKFLESGYENDTITIFTNELEKSNNYNEFDDFCNTISIYRGKTLDDDCDSVGELKMSLRAYKLEEDPTVPAPDPYFENVPNNAPVECLLRLFVLRAFDLQPSDSNGLADPYIEIKLGKKEVNSREQYMPNTLSPVFGKMFELKCTVPLEKDLYIRVKDYDLIGKDDLIGETKIDLENRLMTRFRATCGIPRNYYVDGPFRWRDSQTPRAILDSFCHRYRLPTPQYAGTAENTRLRIGGRVFRLREFENKQPLPTMNLGPDDERLALHVLNRLPLVKEHIETRPLYSTGQIGVEQGKLQMWLDIFPLSTGPPGPPPNIAPRNAKKFELRVIIWNTYDVVLDEANIFGERMSDIYVKGWLSGREGDKQETDVHYRSLNGEGNFNWRYIFQFDYLIAEQLIRVSKKKHFWSLDETVDFHRPVLNIQVWDNDIFNPDDFLGTLELDLTRLVKPAKSAEKCSLDQLPSVSGDKSVNKSPPIETFNLFECRRQRGVWPCYSDEDGTRKLTGKLEMEIELLTAEESELRKAGRARDDPNENPHLDPPNRPETSFLWITSPWKSFKHIFWKKFKWYIIGGLIILLLALFLALFLYSVPGATVNRILGV